ncbi:MAG: DUF4249 domain-containing protein [Bacteroidota bacterium]
MSKRQIFLLMAISIMACKKPYNPKVIDSPKSYLVVEGVINTNDTTAIKISRTVNISNSHTINPVAANVSIESDVGESYPLYQTAAGIYTLAGIQLDGTHKYRLNITTLDNENQYRSDFVAVKDAPAIDSVGFKITGKGIQIYTNTHDPANHTRYYRYDYLETWKFHSAYSSSWKSDGSSIVPRPPEEQVFYCFKSNASSSIILGSTAKLKQDMLVQLPVTEIESTSEKIELKYSILLRQYALTAEAYKFWETLKKNTEQLGSIFDAEPTQLAGNIHNINDNSDVVIGFISAGAVSLKRVFIANEQLPAGFMTVYPYQCALDSSFYDEHGSHANTVQLNLVTGLEVPVSAIFSTAGPSPAGFLGSDALCVDCTLRGTTKQPDFWQ